MERLKPQTQAESEPLAATIAQVTRGYSDKLENLVYRAWATLKYSGYAPGPLLQGVKEQVRDDHKRFIRELAPQSFAEGLREGGVDPAMIDDDDLDTIKEWTNSQLSFVNNFSGDVVAAAQNQDARDAIVRRIGMWVDSMRNLGEQGILSAKRNAMGTWRLNAHHVTLNHCESDSEKGTIGCAELDGKRHRLKWFTSRGYIPRAKDGKITCAPGGECGCAILDDEGRVIV